jgi:hypothetical protein
VVARPRCWWEDAAGREEESKSPPLHKPQRWVPEEKERVKTGTLEIERCGGGGNLRGGRASDLAAGNSANLRAAFVNITSVKRGVALSGYRD